MSLAETLIRVLTARFAGRAPEVQEGEEPAVIFTSPHPEVGRVLAIAEADEVTVALEQFTHGHFQHLELPFDEAIPRIVDDVAEFLDALFDDRVVFYGDPERGGGWREYARGQTVKPHRRPSFVWSGPLPR